MTALSTVALPATATLPATAAPSPTRPATGRFAALTPAVQASRLQPLRDLASALDATGRRTRFAATYGGVRIDAAAGRTVVLATSTAAASAIRAAARAMRPDLSWSRAGTALAAHSRRSLDAAVLRYIRGPHPAGTVSVAVSPDNQGLVVSVTGRSAPRLAPAVTSAGIPVRYSVTARPSVAKSWAAVKWHDRSPFIGGDVLTSDGKRYCTAGLPAIRRSDHHPVLITAAHCFGVGKRVYTGAGTSGHYGNGKVGSYVGKVTAKILQWDAEIIDGTDNNGDMSGTSTWRRLTSVAYSYDGDYVCQAGAASFYLGHPTPCGIKVTNDDITFRMGSYWVRGVEGIDVRHGWGSHNGDSGGTVFAMQPGGRRQARGIVSSGGEDGTPDQRRVDWPEAVDIFRGFRVALNPRT